MSADWRGGRHSQKVSCTLVDWETWEEAGEYPYASGGSLEFGAYTDLRATGSLSFEGPEAPPDGMLVRVSYSFEDDAGEKASEVLGTFMAECSAPTWRETRAGPVATGTLELSSVLKALSDRLCGRALHVPAGTPAVAEAADMCRRAGLMVSVGAESSYVTASGKAFEAGDSWLSVVNWLLSAAGWSGARPDPYGRVSLRPYVEPTARTPMWSFAPGDRSIVVPGVPVTTDWHKAPNVCCLSYVGDAETIWARAANVDPSHRASLPSRGGREVTYVEEVGELAGDTEAQRLDALKALARRRLVAKSAEIEYAEVSHPWVPLWDEDACSVDYAGHAWTGTASNVSLTLGGSMATKTKIRRCVPAGIAVEVAGGIE